MTGNGAEQVHDHRRRPERHVAPRQHIAQERFGHERQVDDHAEQPQQFARRLVRAVQQRAVHVQIDHQEECRGAGRMQIAHQPAVRDLAHDEFDRVERGRGADLVEHGQEDAGHQLHHQHQQRQRAEEIPDVEVLRRVVLGQRRGAKKCVDRQALVDPAPQPAPGGGRVARLARSFRRHQAAPCVATSSEPITRVSWPRKL